MQAMKSLIYIVFLGGILTLSACGDKQEDTGKEAAPTTGGQTAQSVTQKALDADACNIYFAQMQSCVKSQMTQQDQQQLESSLSFLKQQIKQLDDQEQIAKICQKSLDTIEAQKKQIGCI